jgi:hypothetical protein
MKILDILLIFIICFIIYRIVASRKSINKKQIDKNEEHFNQDIFDIDDTDDMYIDEILKHKKDTIKPHINANFSEVQFHNDYRDTISAFNDIAPSQKQVFNKENVPIKFSNPSSKEVKYMIKDFMKELNQINKNDKNEFRNSNSGWDDLKPDKRIKSGWEKQMEKLGLPSNIYNDPACKSKIILLAIDHVEKYETERQIRYVCYIFIQKKNVVDQMVVRISFVTDKADINEDRDFFKDTQENLKVIIEEIFILGFMSPTSSDKLVQQVDSFYNFDSLERTDAISDTQITKELIKKYKERTAEMNSFNATLDTEGRNFHRDIPNVECSESYKTTQTIFDDMNNNKTFS